MTDLGLVWEFTRFRLRQSLEGLTDDQLRQRPFEGGHSIVEIVYHIAGAEHYWGSRLAGIDPNRSEYDVLLDRAIHDGFLNEKDFPFGLEDLNRAAIEKALDYTEELIRPIFENPTNAHLTMNMLSPIGDPVTGKQGLTRLAQHAGYHTGQIWMIRMKFGF